LRTEVTRAVRFLYGYYMLWMYVHDRMWVTGLFPEIFPIDPERKDLYLAAWEGYLSNKLHPDLFAALAEQYNRAIQFDPAQYTKRRYHTGLDNGLATHLALAYAHDSGFSLTSALFQRFWQTGNNQRQEQFIAFIGRYCVLREDADDWSTENEIDLGKLTAFWDWALQNCKKSPALAAFGYWSKVDANIFDRSWLAQHIRLTLEETNGAIDRQFAVMASLRSLVSVAPEQVLESLRLHLLVGRSADPGSAAYVDDELVALFKELYAMPVVKNGTRKLINDLLPVGNGQFWRLKEAMA
jgi:hypothetical protein